MQKISVLVISKDESAIRMIKLLLPSEHYQVVCYPYNSKHSGHQAFSIVVFDPEFLMKEMQESRGTFFKLLFAQAAPKELFVLGPVDSFYQTLRVPVQYLAKCFEKERFISLCETIRIREQQIDLWPKIGDLANEFLSRYSKEQLEKDIRKMLPKMASEVISREIEKIGSETKNSIG